MAEKIGPPIKESMIIYSVFDGVVKKSSKATIHIIPEDESKSFIRIPAAFKDMQEGSKQAKDFLFMSSNNFQITLEVFKSNKIDHEKLLQPKKRIKIYFQHFEQIYFFYAKIKSFKPTRKGSEILFTLPEAIYERQKRVYSRIKTIKKNNSHPHTNILNISLSGMLLETKVDLKVEEGNFLHLDIRLPEGTTDSSFYVDLNWALKVIRVERGAYLILGCQFLNLSEKDYKLLQKYIIKLKRKDTPLEEIQISNISVIDNP